MPDSCPLCQGPMYSITTRRVGEVALCINCGDKVLPLINLVNERIASQMQEAMANGVAIEDAVLLQCKELNLTSEECKRVTVGF